MKNDRIPTPLYVEEINIETIEKETITRYWLKIVEDGLGTPISIPVIVAKGAKEGKTVGITAAVHGNELNGISVIQKLFSELDTRELKGTIVGIPVVNVPSYIRNQRRFIDDVDLNHIMPGAEFGNVSHVYTWRVVNKIINQFDYLLDLHTASNGRVNSYYVRADMNDVTVQKMALLQNAQIIVHNPPSDGTLRGTANELGIPAITMEVGNPNLFQKGLIRDGLTGIYNLLGYLNLLDCEVEEDIVAPIICKKSYWIYTAKGGLLTVHSQLTELVEKGDKIATIRNIFGDIVEEYFAPEKGVIIGKNVNPVSHTGGRVLHLGILKT
ncbi:succinylglutamate desuccinylase/aspartoacylase family protein [Kordia jejudonensis]|uniref:succinylglutamate desuccinylase/aspartoacylase family protein n=1 Tax=Kordia jejudonensis TaxID=1348245 RepID=UPI0006296CD1|nr:succinylglutamate desuccinylase/aspartoacylase family protein [Kordia jejudonensis]